MDQSNDDPPYWGRRWPTSKKSKRRFGETPRERPTRYRVAADLKTQKQNENEKEKERKKRNKGPRQAGTKICAKARQATLTFPQGLGMTAHELSLVWYRCEWAIEVGLGVGPSFGGELCSGVDSADDDEDD